MTLTKRLEAYLQSFCTEIHSRSSKYRLFKQNHDVVQYYHLGKAGAVRVSKKGNITDSISVSDHMKERLIKWEKQCG